jgi:hypothetical protein
MTYQRYSSNLRNAEGTRRVVAHPANTERQRQREAGGQGGSFSNIQKVEGKRREVNGNYYFVRFKSDDTRRGM